VKNPDCFKPWCGIDGKYCVDCKGDYEVNEKQNLDDAVKAAWPEDTAARKEEEWATRKANVSQALLRPNSRELLLQKIHLLRREANSLEALNRALPLELSPAADDALFELLSRR
jgi:hypothetical protein